MSRCYKFIIFEDIVKSSVIFIRLVSSYVVCKSPTHSVAQFIVYDGRVFNIIFLRDFISQEN